MKGVFFHPFLPSFSHSSCSYTMELLSFQASIPPMPTQHTTPLIGRAPPRGGGPPRPSAMLPSAPVLTNSGARPAISPRTQSNSSNRSAPPRLPEPSQPQKHGEAGPSRSSGPVAKLGRAPAPSPSFPSSSSRISPLSCMPPPKSKDREKEEKLMSKKKRKPPTKQPQRPPRALPVVCSFFSL